MIWLWIAAALVSAGLATLVMQRAARATVRAHADNPALAVYRRQMAELDELADRGVLAEGERRSVRAETGRRLLAAAERAEPPLRAARPGAILLAAAAIPLAAVIVYRAIGQPQYPDEPFAQRLAEWRAADPQTLTPQEMAAVLRAIAAERPTDPAPLEHLASAELASGEPTEATQALGRALALAPRRADLWEMLGEIRVMEAGGDIGPDARDDFRQAVRIDPNSPTARYFLGRARIAAGDVAGGLADWRALEASLPPKDPRRGELETDINQVSTTGRLPQPQAPSAPVVGPPQIQAMVDSLAAQLKAKPDDPAGWVRLVRAYSVLGETDRRDAALAEARRRYAGRPDVLGQLTAAARPPS